MSRAGRYLRLVFHDQDHRARVLSAYIHHRNLYAKGSSEIGGLFQIVNFQSGMVAWLFLKSIFPDLPLWALAAGFFAAVVGRTVLKWYLGYCWDKHRVFDAETEWQNARNPTLVEIHKGVRDGHI
jgi:hypothetical protein